MTSPQNEENMALPVTRTPISGYLKVSIGSRHIPRKLAIGNYNDKIVYAGHPAECSLCGKGYHIS